MTARAFTLYRDADSGLLHQLLEDIEPDHAGVWIQNNVRSMKQQNLPEAPCIRLLFLVLGEHQLSRPQHFPSLLRSLGIPVQRSFSRIDTVKFDLWPQIDAASISNKAGSATSRDSVYSITGITRQPRVILDLGSAWRHSSKTTSTVGVVWRFREHASYHEDHIIRDLVTNQRIAFHPLLLMLFSHIGLCSRRQSQSRLGTI